MAFLRFPDDFLWGAATSAHQIEGGHDADGKGPSTWDVFETQPGRIAHGHTAQVACDHYHRSSEDVALMKSLGLQAYRFSIAWPRVQPHGLGPVNEPGMDFYDRLVDKLLEAGIQPFATLYHWDLPQPLQTEIGGWESREIIPLFADYAELMAERLGDRVTNWITHNEPGATMEAYLEGTMPPGAVDVPLAYQVAHNVLVSHGLATQALRAVGGERFKIGLAADVWPIYPATDDPADIAAAELLWEKRYSWFLEPLGLKRYPIDAWEALGLARPKVLPGDMELIGQKLDFLGINHYTRVVTGKDGEVSRMPGSAYTDMDWEVFPPGFYDCLARVHQNYKLGPFYITENGAAFPDIVGPDGVVHDQARQDFYAAYLAELHHAVSDGVPVLGYFAWSLLDNFEWAYGYDKRFGLVHVDFDTLKRTPKQSALWYRDAIKANGVEG
jgi:beta-glucosidase